jgi:hypothetical protein
MDGLNLAVRLASEARQRNRFNSQASAEAKNTATSNACNGPDLCSGSIATAGAANRCFYLLLFARATSS